MIPTSPPSYNTRTPHLHQTAMIMNRKNGEPETQSQKEVIHVSTAPPPPQPAAVATSAAIDSPRCDRNLCMPRGYRVTLQVAARRHVVRARAAAEDPALMHAWAYHGREAMEELQMEVERDVVEP